MSRFLIFDHLQGPILTKWYKTLDKVKATSVKVAFAKRIALDQLVFAPIAIGCITAAVTLADGKTQEEVENKLKTDFFSILGTNYKVSSRSVVAEC